MSPPLLTYLNDHIGGARVAIELLEAMQERESNSDLRAFAMSLLHEVRADDATLHEIAARAGSGTSAVKAAGGWLLEKMARLKLGLPNSMDFGTFESLELLVLGIRGKACLWTALRVVAQSDPRLADHDFESLLKRAEQQYQSAEEWRLRLAEKVFVQGR